MRALAVSILVTLCGGCFAFGFFEDPPCDSEADCSGQGGDGDADADGDADGDADVPADFNGLYHLVVLNEENGCEVANWQAGQSQNVDVEITQDPGDDEATAVVLGWLGTILRLSVGTDALVGDVTGNEIELVGIGNEARDEGTECRTRPRGTMYGTLDVDELSGRIEYTFVILSAPGTCGTKEDCVSTQSFTGLR